MTKQRISLSRMGNNHSSSGVTHHNNGHTKEHSHNSHQQQHTAFQISGYSSTRPFKFCEDEKVLCYEPDPTKAKVLYDAKVLEVVVTKDTRGRRIIEYLIHFQGWNSSWDRCVAEEFVLKDTDENRQLQNDLNEKANALKQALKKGKRGRTVKVSRTSTTSHPTSDHGDDSSKSSWSDGESSEPDSSDDEGGKKEEVQICIPDELKRKLEDDYFSIKSDRWIRLPCETTAVHILEDYVKYFGFSEIKALSERQKNKKPVSNASASPTLTCSTNATTGATTSANAVKGECSKGSAPPDTPEQDEYNRVFRKVSLLKEIVEGVRIMFDFLVGRILLYPEEEEQFAAKPPEPNFPRATAVRNLTWSLPKLIGSDGEEIQEYYEPPAKRTRASNSADAAFGISKFSSSDIEMGYTSSRRRRSNSRPFVNIETTDVKLMQYLDKLNDWELIPLKMYMTLRCPSLVYGSVHLLRLFVKIPEVLSQTTIPRRRMKIVVKHMNLFLEYLAKQNYLFGERLFASRARIQSDLIENELVKNIKEENVNEEKQE